MKWAKRREWSRTKRANNQTCERSNVQPKITKIIAAVKKIKSQSKSVSRLFFASLRLFYVSIISRSRFSENFIPSSANLRHTVYYVKHTSPERRLSRPRAGGEGQWWRRSLAWFNVFVITQTFVRQAATVACSLWLFIILNVFIITQTYVCQAAIATHFNDTPLSLLSFLKHVFFRQPQQLAHNDYPLSLLPLSLLQHTRLLWHSIIFSVFVFTQTHVS